VEVAVLHLVLVEAAEGQHAALAEAAVQRMGESPAAGPLTLNCDPLSVPITRPPTMPPIIPENKGALLPSAMPRQSGSATRNTTTDAGKSDERLLI